jgi:TPR repeat protein
MTKVKRWYKKARKNDILVAYSRIGEMLFSDGQYQDSEEQFIYLTSLGDVYSQNRLRIFYREGYPKSDRVITGINYDMAFKWFLKVAEQNYSQAQYTLVRFYEHEK